MDWLNESQIMDINTKLRNLEVWNCLNMEKLEVPYVTGHHLAGTMKLPFNGGFLLDHYKESFGVDISHRMSPIVMDRRQLHAMEYIWFRHEMECTDPPIEEEEAEEEDEEETEVELSELESAESDNDY